MVDYPDRDGNDYFAAWFAGAELLNLSDFLTYQSDADFVTSGKYQTAPGHLSKFAENGFAGLNYDNTDHGGTIKFYLGGGLSDTATDYPDKSGLFYTEKKSAGGKNLFGTGNAGGKSLYLTGSMSLSGSKQFAY